MNKIMTNTLDALKIAREALKERRGYCSQWEYKYGHEWDNEDGYIQNAIDKLAELDRIESEKPHSKSEFRRLEIQRESEKPDICKTDCEFYEGCLETFTHKKSEKPGEDAKEIVLKMMNGTVGRPRGVCTRSAESTPRRLSGI